MTEDFLDQRGDYHTLKAYMKAECIYDVTFYFAHQFLPVGDRTIDQMIQAARSGKQNIAEGYVDGMTSKEMMLKLINIDRGSLQELLIDYEDYLRVRGLEQWKLNDPRCQQARRFCHNQLESSIYREKIRCRSDETIANIAITLIHQEDVLIKGFIEWIKRDFLHNGGFKEQLYRARTQYRGYGGGYGYRGSRTIGADGTKGANGDDGANRANGSNGSNGDDGSNGVTGKKHNPSTPSTPSTP